MKKYTFKLEELLKNPTGALTDYKIKPKSLEQLQPIIIISGSNRDAQVLANALKQRGIEFYINPTAIERPVKGYPIDLREIELIY